MKVQFIDLKTQYKKIEEEVKEGLHRVLEHGRYVMGPEIDELETELAGFAGVKHAISCSSGTDALLMPLMAWGLKPGDAVFTTPFTFIATAEVILLLGAVPVFVDIDPKTFNMDPNLLEEKIKQVKAEGRLTPRGIIPVDLFGLPADYDAINAIANEHELFVLEDAAQSLGGTYKGKPVGGLGHVAATSFYPAKPLGCYGDGGAIFTDDDEMAELLKSIRVHGQGTHRYDNVRVGINGRMDSMQAAVLLAKLKLFPQELKDRQRVADAYAAGLKGVTTAYTPEGYTSAWAQYSVLHDDRDGLMKKLGEEGVPTVIYYPKPLHFQDAFAEVGFQAGDYPVSEASANRIFSLPMHPFLTTEELDFICAAVNRHA